jgi:glycosyltransferase involved in cell wall biosynthesis
VRVCLISSVHLWVNPRLIKEADWLTEQGHDVRVVTKSTDAWSDGLDDALLREKRWSADRINLLRGDRAGHRRWLTTAIRSALAMRMYAWTGGVRFAEEGYYRGFADVLSAARRTRADLFIAHTQGALPIAARAVAATGARFGFDCEDLLAEEASDGLQNSLLRRAILDIERRYLPSASYVTATSQAMADYLVKLYGIPAPFVVRNVFARSGLNGVPAPRARPSRDSVELVWISATIGHGRGLEDALEALAALPGHVRLTIFGRMFPAYEAPMMALLGKLGVASRVTVRPVVEPAAIMPTIAQYDIGLTLDLNDCLNRSLTISNKVFVYLQAGLAVGATDTPGQREVIDSVPTSGFLYEPGDVRALTAALAALARDRVGLLAAQDAAWRAGQERYNWDRDAEVFRSAFEAATL